MNRDAAALAVRTIRRWRAEIGSACYPDATRLQRNPRDLRVITADGGGGNGSRVRLWKCKLQRFADELSITRKSQVRLR